MILLVDDDPSITASLALLLKQAGYRSVSAASPAQALVWLAKEHCDLVLQDMNFSRQTTGEEGLELLRAIKAGHPQLPVILMTAWGSIELAVRGVKAGAADFVTKPWTNEQLVQAVKTTLSLATTQTGQSGVLTREELDRRWEFRNLIGRDPQLLRILEVAGRVSATDASVLITGESGTGKDEVAAAIVRNSQRRAGPFIRVNLGGIAAALFESEMFGHVKGAFTDAHQDRQGRFELAHGGTIFLDEIGDLGLSCQVKLLRVLQDRTFEVLGSSRTQVVDLRVISATNRNLPELVEKGEFREDLLYRLNLISLHLSPLRERREDVPLLAHHFAQQLGQVYRRGNLEVSEAALHWLQDLTWPGNIRQLRQVIERAVLMSSAGALQRADLELAMEMQPEERSRAQLPTPGTMTLDQMEERMIRQCLTHYGGNLTRVAEALGLSRAALYRRLEKYGIEL
ncbi:MAG: sigma-54-dependent Fis family transcriptional regulator [Candidatus Latescibacteria bacterium]|nr:sigma-54-dependent Fis family transcriptional regulator [Candidatus Latescibacterota bacterium]